MNTIRRTAPWALIALSALFALFGIGDIVIGIQFEPTTAVALTGLTPDEIRAESEAGYTVIDHMFRSGGVTLALFAALLTIILLIPYRAGERWAWWVAWALPVWAAAVFAVALVRGTAEGQSLSPVALSGVAFAVITAALLLVDAGRFRRPADRLVTAPAG
jgi:hypothetical protein